MPPSQFVPGRPQRMLATLALLLAAAGLVAGTGARFSAQATNPSNTFSAGTLAISDSEDGAAILTATGLKPGGTERGVVDIENTGSITGTLSVSRTQLSDSDPANPLSAQLDLLVRDCGNFSAGTPACQGGDPVMYTGKLAEMTQSSELGAYVPGERHRYEFEIAFAADAGNPYQGDSATATFRWDATQ